MNWIGLEWLRYPQDFACEQTMARVDLQESEPSTSDAAAGPSQRLWCQVGSLSRTTASATTKSQTSPTGQLLHWITEPGAAKPLERNVRRFHSSWGYSDIGPAVYHSWPQAGKSLQMLPHVLSESTQRNDIWHTLVWPGGVVVVCDYPFFLLVPLEKKRFICSAFKEKWVQSLKGEGRACLFLTCRRLMVVIK